MSQFDLTRRRRCLLAIFILIGGIGAAGCTTTRDANAQGQATVAQLKFNCQPRRDAALEKLLTDAGTELTFEGKPAYCTSELDAAPANLADKKFVIVWANTEANCGRLGCPVFVYSEAPDRALKSAMGDDFWAMTDDGNQITSRLSPGKIELAIPTTDNCVVGDQPCPTKTDPKTGGKTVQNRTYRNFVYDNAKKLFR